MGRDIIVHDQQNRRERRRDGGSVDIEVGGTPLEVRGSRRRLLLATLVLHRSSVCGTEHLIDVLADLHALDVDAMQAELSAAIDAQRRTILGMRQSGAIGEQPRGALGARDAGVYAIHGDSGAALLDRLAVYPGAIAMAPKVPAVVLSGLLEFVSILNGQDGEHGEHGGTLHGGTLYEEVTRVPLFTSASDFLPVARLVNSNFFSAMDTVPRTAFCTCKIGGADLHDHAAESSTYECRTRG